MKRLLLLLTVCCVSLASCSDKSEYSDIPNVPSNLKRFDFSEVDTDNLQGIRENPEFDLSDLTLLTGVLNDCLWVGVFDTESGSLKCQYTDVDHPTSYFEYGEEYKYGVGVLNGVYFEKNKAVFVIQYSDSDLQYRSYWLDLVVTDGNTDHRFVIDEKGKGRAPSTSIAKWADSAICIVFGEGYNGNIIYDLDRDRILCKIKNQSVLDFHNMIYDDNFHVMISHTDILHFWTLFFHDWRLSIAENQCTYDAIASSGETFNVFDLHDVNYYLPRYSFEYRTKTNDHISTIITQTEYNGTVMKKIVDIRLENDELKVDIQKAE